MSVYGGDSWAREAQHRKRRVDDLMMDGLDSSSYKKLSNGKFTCVVCPNSPLLDSSLMLSMHNKGARHRAALSKHKEKELTKQEEINKRIALSDDITTSAAPRASAQRLRLPSKPLIEQTRKAATEVLHSLHSLQSNSYENHGVKSNDATVSVHYAVEVQHQHGVGSHHTSGADAVTAQHQLDLQKLREKELKFTAAGWKRDCHGKWYRDENVEFDSDEEDPNISLA